MKIAWKAVSVLLLLTVLIIVGINSVILNTTRDRIFESPEDIPFNQAGLLLGTSKRLSSGGLNPYFQYRVEAAVDLFKSGRISYIIASGNTEQRYYDEPEEFRKELLLRGVPDDRIFLDGKGYRTIDSVTRCRDVFGFSRCTIITQRFHAPRALYLADALGMDAVAYSARDVEPRQGLKTQFREIFARVKAFSDVHITDYRSGRRIE